MALTGRTVQSSYLDLVQLEQSGAGLPSHAGKEAALYDGSGAQILGRSAVRHWLDPHPDAASFNETWEFSTTGDMTQGQLEAEGWTFSGCTGVVSNGVFWITGTDANSCMAYLTVSLAGDFDFLISPIAPFEYGATQQADTAYFPYGGIAVADTATDVKYSTWAIMYNGWSRPRSIVDGKWTDDSGTLATSSVYGAPPFLRINRVSGQVYLGCAQIDSFSLVSDTTSFSGDGLFEQNTVASAATFNRVALIQSANKGQPTGFKTGYRFLRRFQ